MILSSADILRILGGNQIIRLAAKVQLVENKPAISGREGLFIYIKRYPELAEFEATFTLWIESDGSEPDDIVIAELKKLLPKVQVKPGLMTEVKTTEFRSESTLEAPAAAPIPQVDMSALEARFEALAEDIQDQMLLVHSGRNGQDGRDGRDGVDGRDGRDLVATEANLEDLQNVEQNIAKEDGQVLTWKDGVWQNLFIPQIVSSISSFGGGTTINKLDDIGDVDVPSPGDGSVLAFSTATGNWEAVAAPPADISGSSIDDLFDVDTSTTLPEIEEPLVWDGTNWVPGQHVSVTSVKLDTTNLASPALGQLEWEQDENTAVLGIDGNIHLHLGHDQFAWCRNSTGSTIAAGTAVMFAGTLGASGRILVAPMVANGTQPGYVFLGIAAESIAPGTDGNVISYGKLKGINTLGYPEGAILWCDPAVPGGLTATEPSAPSLKLPVAAVISSKSNGTLMVRWSTGDRLKDLHDVESSAPQDGEVLTWVDSNNRWEPQAIPPAGIPEAPTDGNYYVRSSGLWVKLTDALASLGVTFSEPIDGGNFITGQGTAITNRVYDGGNFTDGSGAAPDSIVVDGGLTTP